MRLTSLIIGVLLLMAFSAGFLGSRRSERQMSRMNEARNARAEAMEQRRKAQAQATAPTTQPAPAVPVKTPVAAPATPEAETPKVQERPEEKGTVGWKIVGPYCTSAEEARQAALTLAQKTVAEYLEKQSPAIHQPPAPAYITARMVKDQAVKDRVFEGSVGKMYWAELEIRLTPEVRTELARQERQYQSEQRMAWLFKILGIAVALLAAITGFLRLDDMTKGYYTGWLRLAALGFVGGTILFLVFLA